MGLAGISTILALGLAACSMPVKIPPSGVPPDQYQDMNCEAVAVERTRRLLAERDDLNSPLLSSKTDAPRELRGFPQNRYGGQQTVFIKTFPHSYRSVPPTNVGFLPKRKSAHLSARCGLRVFSDPPRDVDVVAD